jgi:hypothetical protein
MPKISVIVPTNRVGGLDILIASLCQQSFKDFELVIIDCLHEWRSPVILNRLKTLPFPVKYLPPHQNPFPRQAFQRTLNTGFAHATGEIFFVTCDYAFLNPGVLEVRKNLHDRFKRTIACGNFRLLSYPPLHPEFPRGRYGSAGIGTMAERNRIWTSDPIQRTSWCNRWSKAYLQDLGAHTLDRFMWSAFATPFHSGQGIEDLPVISPEDVMREGFLVGGISTISLCCLKNDSFPAGEIFAINGMDEDFDGAHSNQDSELALRLQLNGVQFYVEPNHPTAITDMHAHLTIRQVERPEEENGLLFHRKALSAKVYANPDWKLKDRT